jgi:hypothetical protein
MVKPKTEMSLSFTTLNCQKARKRIWTDHEFTLIRRDNELHSKKYCISLWTENRTDKWQSKNNPLFTYSSHHIVYLPFTTHCLPSVHIPLLTYSSQHIVYLQFTIHCLPTVHNALFTYSSQHIVYLQFTIHCLSTDQNTSFTEL